MSNGKTKVEHFEFALHTSKSYCWPWHFHGWYPGSTLLFLPVLFIYLDFTSYSV